MEKDKKNYKSVYFSLAVMLVILISLFSIDTNNAHAEEKTYFMIGKNYMEDETISKGELDKKVGPIGAPRVPTDTELTYNEFYLKYNYGPEMTNMNSNRYNYNPYYYAYGSGAYVLKQYDSDGVAIRDENGNQKLYEPTPDDKYLYGNNHAGTLGGSNIPSIPDSFMPRNGNAEIKPLFFSYLYVGDGVEGQTNNYSYTKDFLMPDSVGYSETNKVSDYMLNTDNNFVIPARYNEIRDDVTLLMRSKTENQSNTPQVFLEVLNEEGELVEGSDKNESDYLETKISFHLLPFSYNMLGGVLQQSRYRTAARQMNGTVTDVAGFNKSLNDGLDKIRGYSSEGVVQGAGGSTKLTVFYRAGVEDFKATTAERYADKLDKRDVKYYVWQKETLFPNGEGTSGLKSWGADALADKVDGISNVLSPEVTKFKIETSRPTITSETPTIIEYDLNKSNFDEEIGKHTFKVEDEGVKREADADGKSQKIAVDLENVRVRVRETGGEWTAAMKLAELKDKLVNYEGKTVDLLYTYSATDAKAENIMLLPSEISKNTGAYAIPLQKQLKVAERETSTVTIKYMIDGTAEGIFEEVLTGKVGTPYTYTAKDKYEKNGVKYRLVTSPAKIDGTYTDENQNVIFNYEKIIEGTVTVRYVDKDGKVLYEAKAMKDEVGLSYTTSAPATYKKDGKKYKKVETPSNAKGKYTEGNIDVDYVYEEVLEGTVTVRYLDEDGKVLYKAAEKMGEEGASYTTSAPATYKKNGKTYKKVKTPSNAKGKYTADNTNVDYVYEEVITVAKEGTVTVRYVDEDGKVLFKDDLISDEVGKSYTTSAPATYKVDGKTYKKVKTPANAKGKYVLGNTNVDYVYQEVVSTTGGGSTGGGSSGDGGSGGTTPDSGGSGGGTNTGSLSGGSSGGTTGTGTGTGTTTYLTSTPAQATANETTATSKQTLPQTGDVEKVQTAITILGIALFAVCCGLLFRRRNENFLKR